MRSFKEHLAESKKTYSFKVKVAGDFGPAQEKALESLLSRYAVSEFKKKGKTPVQEFPLDFPTLKNSEVSIYEVALDYPTTQFELTEYIANELNITKDHIAVRSPNDPTEEYQMPVQRREGPLLTDSEYNEMPKINPEDYYGDKYNSGFVKELNDILKLQRRERGEVIPENTSDSGAAGKAKFNTDAPENTKSVVNTGARDPRKNII